jgi:hypothetical protein
MIEFSAYVNKGGNNNKDGVNLFFPSHSVPPKEKLTKAWCKQFCQAIYTLYLNNMCAWNYGDIAQIRRLRAYGNGMQDISQYQDAILGRAGVNVTGEGNPSAKGPGASLDYRRKGYANINFNILKIAPKFKTIVVGTFESVEHDVFADGVDEKSGVQRLAQKNRAWIEMKFKDIFDSLEQQTGAVAKKPSYIPESEEELEMYESMGGFRLQSEIAIESALKYTLDISNWKEIKRKLITDLFEIGKAGVKDYVNPQTQKVETRYCDPQYCIIPYRRDSDYRNMPFAGEFIFMTISEIRQLGIFDDEQLFEIANAYATMLGNLTFLNGEPWNSTYVRDPLYSYAWNQFQIAVLDCEFKSDDHKYTTVSTDQNGAKQVKETKFGKVRKSEGRATVETKTEMVYKCKWVVGTEQCWDYGHQFDIPRPTPSKAQLSYHFSKIEGPSMTEMMIEPLDQFQLGFLRAQNAIATAAPSGLAIDVGTMDNVMMGGNKLTSLEIFKIRNQTGNLLYSATTHRGYGPQQSNFKPIQELMGGAGQNLVDALSYMETQIQMIQDITGINRVASAGNPQGQDLVGISEMSLQATATALLPLFSQYVSLKDRMCRNAALRVQLLVKLSGEYEAGYVTALGEMQAKVLKVGSEVNNAMMNIRIEQRPSVEERRQILEAAQVSLQTGRNGQIGISTSDFFLITSMINRGLLKMAQMTLALKEKKAKDEANAQAQKMVEAQGQQNQMLEQQKAQAAQQLLQLQQQNMQMESQLRVAGEIDIENAKHKNKMMELGFTKTVEREMGIETNDTKMQMHAMTEQGKSMKAGIEMAHNSDKLEVEREKAMAKEKTPAKK